MQSGTDECEHVHVKERECVHMIAHPSIHWFTPYLPVTARLGQAEASCQELHLDLQVG